MLTKTQNVSKPSDRDNRPFYLANTLAGQYYGELLGTFTPTQIPLTFGEGSGSDDSHWRKYDPSTEDEYRPLFGDEMMTESANSVGVRAPTSILTIASMADLGYNVNYGAAEPYILPQFRPVATA